MTPIKYKVVSVSSTDEGLMALLSTLPFDSFQEYEDCFDAYIDQDELTDEVLDLVKSYVENFRASYSVKDLEIKNWNQEWESNFNPVEVEDFVRVRAEFHDSLSNDFEFEITIQPKMAFGTGHHQTTYQMMKLMKTIDFDQKIVLDYGCGTGILAILAEKLGSIKIDAIDIEEPSVDNTVENAQINLCNKIHVCQGDLDQLDNEMSYDVILANINRNVLLSSADALFGLINEGGVLLLSGILESDEKVIKEAFEVKLGMTIAELSQHDQWLCIRFEKR
jgi:ribosomal protein L11 methyltransferase